MESIDHILQEAAHLPEDQRLTLAHKILLVGEPRFSKSVEEAWDTEIRDRIARYDRGEIKSRPASEVLADIDRQLKL
jgi:hypothetical protein